MCASFLRLGMPGMDRGVYQILGVKEGEEALTFRWRHWMRRQRLGCFVSMQGEKRGGGLHCDQIDHLLNFAVMWRAVVPYWTVRNPCGPRQPGHLDWLGEAFRMCENWSDDGDEMVWKWSTES